MWAVTPLHYLITRYPPEPSYLTTIHAIFLQVGPFHRPTFISAHNSQTCLSANQPTAALSVLRYPISQISTSVSDLTYNDNLLYHYLGGVILAVLKKWAEAEEFFEICVTAPGAVPAAIQLEALKKLRLVQLISRGEVGPVFCVWRLHH